MKNTILRDAVPTPNPGRPYTGKMWGWGMVLLYTYWIAMGGLVLNAYRHYRTPRLEKTNLVCYK